MKPIFSKIKESPDVISPDRRHEIVMTSMLCLIACTALILLFGITMLYSTSFGTAGTVYLRKQLMWAAFGLAGGAAVLLTGYRRLCEWSVIFMLVTIVALMIADFMFPAVKGANRWIKIPGIGNIQPSEYAKVVVSLFMAYFLSERARFIKASPFWKIYFPGIFFSLCVILFVMIGHDLGTSVLLCCIVAIAMMTAGINKLWFFLPGLVAGVGGYAYIRACDPMRWARLRVFLDPESEGTKSGYQLLHSLYALGSGGWTGLGFAQSRMKMKYLPEAHTDFILSIVGEELGFISILIVICAYAAFVFFASRIAMNARTRQGMILAFCLLSFIGLQAMINIGVVSGAFPTKGMPAPFISYGGSNLVTCMVAVSLIVSVALDTLDPEYQERWQASARDFYGRFMHALRKKKDRTG